MIRRVLSATCLTILATGVFAQEIRVGRTATDLVVRGVDGQTLKYSELSGPVTVLIFFSTRCPISNAFNYRRNALYKEFGGRVKFIVVDSNANESLEEVRDYSRAMEFDVPVYKDVDNIIADRFGVQITTDSLVFDSSGAIRYRGYIEDSPNPNRAKIQGLRLAIEAVLEGKAVPMPETKALGCSIRRVRR